MYVHVLYIEGLFVPCPELGLSSVMDSNQSHIHMASRGTEYHLQKYDMYDRFWSIRLITWHSETRTTPNLEH